MPKRILEGLVVSDKGDKTVIVKVERTFLHPVLKKTVEHYYKELADYRSKAESELSLRTAFHNLLATTARSIKWTLVAEQTIAKGIRPDGVVRDDYFARLGLVINKYC